MSEKSVHEKEINCPNCGSDDIVSCAIRITAYRMNGEKQVDTTEYKECRMCGYEWEENS